MKIVTFVDFTNGFSTKSFRDFGALNFVDFVDLLTVFQRNLVALFKFPIPCDFVDFLMLFQRNSMPTGQDSAPRISIHFVDYSNVFQRNVIAVFHFWTRAFSLIFHWFYNEIRLRQPSFQNWALSIILLMLFQRNCMPAKPHPDFAISLIILMLFHRNFVDFGVSGVFAAFCDFVYNPNAFPSKFRLLRCRTGP